MSQGDDQERLPSLSKEVAPPDFLARLERSAQEAYRSRARAQRRRKFLGVCAGLAAVVPLVWVLQDREATRIIAEQVRPRVERPMPAKATTGAVPPVAKSLPSAIERQEPAPPKRPPAASARVRPPGLSQELAILAQVRRALENDEPKQALDVLDRHGKDLKAGQLRLEAEVLRLEALSKLGAKQEASQRARRFIDENPNSPLSDRVRGYVGQ